ncbi:hypothetical protein [Microbulbifer sp. GL-2]|uniref:hypothetical protein n=1 Tax=Microbulbifer sp. GL-2 TaxID=2591606 RepID=UPI0011633731|nr:hypothetical protein [Microbulbifer sp. GL-2]BBM01617.1 hypothetical protein GL2_16910 [Microbulbifer sp. GL-2]
MHDGQMLFDSRTTWNGQEWGVDEVASRLISEGLIRPFIVVAVHNSGDGRHGRLFPTEGLGPNAGFSTQDESPI